MLPIIPIGDHFYLPTYLVVIALLFSGSLLWVDRRAKAHELNRNQALDFSLALMVGGFLGARLMHVFYEAWPVYSEDPWRIFSIWQGGFVFFGGLFGGWLAALWVFYRYRSPWGPWYDLFAPVLAFGYAVGRIACLLAGCCFGRVSQNPWWQGFLGSLSDRYPTQLLAAFFEFILFLLLLLLEKKFDLAKRLFPGALFLIWLKFHSMGRIFMEFFRADDRGSMPWGLSISTWISLFLMILSSLLLLTGYLRKIRIRNV